MNSRGLSTDPWCTPTWTSSSSLKELFIHVQLLPPSCMACTTLTILVHQQQEKSTTVLFEALHQRSFRDRQMPYTQGLNQRSVNCDLQIEFVFSRITLSSFCEIRESELPFCWNFCLQGNHRVSVYTSSSTNGLYLTPKSVKLYTIFLHLDSILAQNPQWGGGGFTALSHTT